MTKHTPNMGLYIKKAAHRRRERILDILETAIAEANDVKIPIAG